ncbi:MnhB domain-containing protein [Nesterenkonia muleiensis]|uniref:MnhB domain-containing protein n=1 Tax=Nesterenkonia muleiensis TaxID=2282648 RepID=UPI000E74802B|nr:MnhB domain-containing protein [Nesterenkonia muleiensis]
MAEPVDWVLAAAALVAAAVVVLPRSLLPHTRIVQVMGFLLLSVVTSLIWLRLDSVDVALAEAALGGGLLGGALVYVASGPRRDRPSAAATGWLAPVLGTAAGAVLVVILASAWLRVEQTMPGWTDPLQEQLPATGVEHGITGVLLAFRAYDTLLESAVLMLAALAALALRQNTDPGAEPELASFRHTHAGHTARSATFSWMVRLSAPVLLLAGLWLLFAGSSDSGGAFQSGAVLAALLILLRVAGTAPRWLAPSHLNAAQDRLSTVPGRIMVAALVAGVVVFILAGLLGPLVGEPWLSWDPAWAFAVILTVEVLLTAGIAAGLYALYLALEDPRATGERTVRHRTKAGESR